MIDLEQAREAIRAWAHYVYHSGDYSDCWCHPTQEGGPS